MAADVPGAAPVGPRLGTVSAFDAERGLGTVTDDSGASYAFHCTALTDGTRQVVVGIRVTFVTAAGHLGRIEARRLSPAG